MKGRYAPRWLLLGLVAVGASCGGKSKELPTEADNPHTGGSSTSGGAGGTLGVAGGGGGRAGTGSSAGSGAVGATGAVAGSTGSTAGNAGAGNDGAGGASAGSGATGGVTAGEGGEAGLGEGGAGGQPQCDGAVNPVTFVSSAEVTFYQLAFDDDYVYWNDGTAIQRQGKRGDTPEPFAATGPSAFGVTIDGARIYWSASNGSGWSIYAAPLDAPGAVAEVVNDAARVGWAVSNDILYYASVPGGVGGAGGGPGVADAATVVAVPSSGGSPLFTADHASDVALGPFAADTTGAYWAYNILNDSVAGVGGAGNGGAGSSIRKLSVPGGTASDFAPVSTVPLTMLVATGSKVVWVDTPSTGPARVFASNPDGTARVALGSAPLIRGLASDGTDAYWAASAPGDAFSDIFRTPLQGGTTQSLACHVDGVLSMAVDESDVYYVSWGPPQNIARIPKQ